MRIVVTGARGFIGRYLIEELVLNGYEVAAVTRAKEKPCTHPGVVWHLGVDYHRPGSFITPGTGALIHLPAVMPENGEGEKDLWFNLSSTYACYTALARIGGKQFIFASSQMVYGPQKLLPVAEDAPCRPGSAYGLSKLAAENVILDLQKDDGLCVACLRLAEVFGKGQDHGYVRDKFIDLGIAGQPISLFGHYQVMRDFIYIRDAARAFCLALRAGSPGVFNLGGGEGRTLEQFAQGCQKYLSMGRSPLHYGTASQDSPRPPDFYMSIDKARQAFGYQPAFDLAGAMADIRKLGQGCDQI